ncbi:MAG: carbohydrate binding family 9 domain-containing protein [Acidobacteria bacterium]|nr:carbohydrate binding family 9 domain-containing protein [Acidobacteriota bacterium]
MYLNLNKTPKKNVAITHGVPRSAGHRFRLPFTASRIPALLCTLAFTLLISSTPNVCGDDSPRTKQQSGTQTIKVPINKEGPRSFAIRRVDGPPIVEMEFVGSKWLDQATRLEGFTQATPKEGTPASENTVVYVGYDKDNLYLVFYSYDSEPSQIRANYSKRDDIAADDYVGVILDTFNDGRRAYKFLTNPLGVQADSLFAEEGGEDTQFDSVFQSQAKLTTFGYLATMAIPFRSLRYAKSFPQTWGFNLVRSIKRKNEEVFWSPVYRDRRGFLNQAGKLTDLAEISWRRGYELIPYVLGAKTILLDQDSAPAKFMRRSQAAAGLDVKYGFTSSLTADVTINPDFNDLEADQPRIRVNRRFAESNQTFVPEKRPFFLERADIFGTPLNLFFTRKIIDPKYGAKITGKAGRYNLGYLSASDAAPELEFSDDASLFRRRKKPANANVFRLSRDLLEQSSLGLIAIDRRFGREFNRLYGVDAEFRFWEKYELSMQYVRSWARNREESDDDEVLLERSRGSGYMITAARSSRHLSMDLYHVNLAPGFRSDLGFIERSDVKQFGGSLRYDLWPENRALINWGPRLVYGRNYDHKGNLNDVDVEIGLAFELAGNTSMGVKAANLMERYVSKKYRKHPVTFYATTERARKISGGVSGTFGREINYNENDPFLGRARELSFDMSLRPNEHFKLENIYLTGHLINRELLLSRRLPPLRRGFDTHIFQTRLNYQFNREFSLRLIPEYNFLKTRNMMVEDPRLMRVTERTRQLRGSFVLSYVVRPGTVLYAGYNSVLQDLTFRSARRLRSGDRGFFIKMSYLFR